MESILTPREKEILELATIHGLSNNQISDKLDICRSHVTYTKRSICRKLKINRVAEYGKIN